MFEASLFEAKQQAKASGCAPLPVTRPNASLSSLSSSTILTNAPALHAN